MSKSANDIAGLVDYEHLYELKLIHPKTDKELGITFMIRSAGSDAVKSVIRRQTDEGMKLRMRNKPMTSEKLEKNELEKSAAYIASWDWGGKTWNGETPELTPEKAMEILAQEGWIYAQVNEAANSVANFS